MFTPDVPIHGSQCVSRSSRPIEYWNNFWAFSDLIPLFTQQAAFRSFARILIISLKIRRQKRLSLNRVVLNRCALHCLGNCTAASGCQYSHVRSNAIRFFLSKTWQTVRNGTWEELFRCPLMFSAKEIYVFLFHLMNRFLISVVTV